MESSNKKIKIITNFDTTGSSSTATSLKNLSCYTTLGNLKQLTQLLNQKEKIGLFYLNREIIISNENETIEQIFIDVVDIVIEIRQMKNIEIRNKFVFSYCEKHLEETANLYCETCKCSLCFKCSVKNIHNNHLIIEKNLFFDKKYTGIIEKFKKVQSSFEEDQFIKNITNLKEVHLSEVENDFNYIIENVQEIKKYYLNFYTEYFNFLKEKNEKINKEYSTVDYDMNELNEKFSIKNEINSTNLEKLNYTENKVNNFLKNYKMFKDLSNMTNDFDFEYINNINSILHRFSIIKSEYFSEEKLKNYESFKESENEQIQLKNYLKGLSLSISEDFKKGEKEQEKYFHNIVSLPIQMTKNVLIYNFTTRQFSLVTVNHKNREFKFNDYSRYINFGNFLFIAGGTDNDVELFSTFVVSLKDTSVVQTANLNNKRSQHSLVLTSINFSNYIFAVSGYNNPTIEIFDPSKNLWTEFKSLNKARCNSNLIFVDDNKYLYVFGGSDGDKYLDSFERIELTNFSIDLEKNFKSFSFKHSFEIFKFFNSGSNLISELKLNYSGYGVIPTNEKNQFLVIGGFNVENDPPLTEEIRLFEYDKDSKNILLCNTFTLDVKDTLPNACCFYYQNFLSVEKNLMAQFTANGDMITYNTNDNKFTILTHDIKL